MNVNDHRVIASSKRFNESLDKLAATGTPRHSVAKHPKKRGYTLIDLAHRESVGDDIEGVGLVYFQQPKVLPSHTGWYRYRRDAEARAEALNRDERQNRPAVSEEPDGPATLSFGR
jgi:hypothetical protein